MGRQVRLKPKLPLRADKRQLKFRFVLRTCLIPRGHITPYSNSIILWLSVKDDPIRSRLR